MNIYGEYSPYGYVIYNENGAELYRAGNSPYDSQQVVGVEHGLPLKTIHDYCDQTGQEIADENGYTYTGSYFTEY